MGFFAKRTAGVVVSGRTGTKSFNTSYGSEYKKPFRTFAEVKPRSIV